MKLYRALLLWIALGMLAATCLTSIAALQIHRINEARAALICNAITTQVQVGAFRDAYDHAYSLAQLSTNGRRVPVSMLDGEARYGQESAEPSGSYREECKVESRPDFLLTFFFDRPPVFGLGWLAYAIIFSILFYLSYLVFKFFSSQVFESALGELSKGIGHVFKGEKAAGLMSRLTVGFVEKAPAIQELKQEISKKAELAKENSEFREKLSALTKATLEKENERKKVSEIVQQFKHDIGGPIAYLRTFLLLGEYSKEPIEGAFLSLKKIEKLKDDLSQIEGTDIAIERVRELALVECVMHEVFSAKKVFWRASVNVEYSFDPKSLSLSPVDAGRLGRIFDNLLQNSYEAISDVGSICVRIEKSIVGVVVAISDNGCGIPQHVLDRLGSTRVTFGKTSGNGIGLLRAKQWVDAWGGNFSVESKEGRGTTIQITLPIKATGAKFTADLSWLKNNNVVVVDDDALAAKSLLSKVGGSGLHFPSLQKYADWLDASEGLDGHTASVYDLRLNPGSGLDLLRLNPEPEKALLYTNDYLDSEAMALSATLGFYIYPKPFLAL